MNMGRTLVGTNSMKTQVGHLAFLKTSIFDRAQYFENLCPWSLFFFNVKIKLSLLLLSLLDPALDFLALVQILLFSTRARNVCVLWIWNELPLCSIVSNVCQFLLKNQDDPPPWVA